MLTDRARSKALRGAAAVAAVTLLGGCVVVPVIEPPVRRLDCQLVTRQFNVTVLGYVPERMCSGIRAEDCLVLMAAGGAVFAASAVVSGSVVMVGNTIHWIEKTNRCNVGPPAERAPPLADPG